MFDGSTFFPTKGCAANHAYTTKKYMIPAKAKAITAYNYNICYNIANASSTTLFPSQFPFASTIYNKAKLNDKIYVVVNILYFPTKSAYLIKASPN